MTVRFRGFAGDIDQLLSAGYGRSDTFVVWEVLEWVGSRVRAKR
jgi:hypothetical protein